MNARSRFALALLAVLALPIGLAAAPLYDLGTSRCSIVLVSSETANSRTYTPSLSSTITFSNGSGASKAEKVASATITLSGGAAQQIALTSSSTFEDAAGDAITFTNIKAIGFSTPSGNSASMVIGAAGSADWDTLLNAAGTLTLPAGSTAAFMTTNATGWSVTASDIINVDGDGTDAVTIWVLGEV